MNAAAREDVFLPCLKGLSLFRALGDEQLRFLAAGCEVMEFGRGQLVCEKGGRPEGFFCVLEGKVKLAVLSRQGTERVVEIVQPGNSFAEALMFLDEPSPVYAEALTKTLLVFVRRTRILAAIRHWPEVSMALLGSMSIRIHRLVRDVESCCLQSAPQRVVKFLLEHAIRVDGADAAEVVLPAGKAVVASSLNLTPETFSRELHQLANHGYVDVDRRTIRIPNLNRLKASLAI